MSVRLISAALLMLAAAGCASVPGLGSLGESLGDSLKRDRAEVDLTPPDASVNASRYTVSERSRERFDEAISALDAGELTAAERLFRQITKDQPELPAPWINLAQMARERGDVEAAGSILRAAVDADANNCPALTALGVLSRQAGDLASAESYYLSCLARDESYADAHYNLGILYEIYLGRLPDALLAYRKYQALTDTDDRRVAGWVMDLERRIGAAS